MATPTRPNISHPVALALSSVLPLDLCVSGGSVFFRLRPGTPRGVVALLVAGAVLQGLGRRGVEEVVRAEGSEVRVPKRVDGAALDMVVPSVSSRRADLSERDSGRIVRALK